MSISRFQGGNRAYDSFSVFICHKLTMNDQPQSEEKKMDVFTATMIAEGVEEASEERTIEAWQFLIDTGTVWKLQGWFGRTARDLISAGICKAQAS